MQHHDGRSRHGSQRRRRRRVGLSPEKRDACLRHAGRIRRGDRAAARRRHRYRAGPRGRIPARNHASGQLRLHPSRYACRRNRPDVARATTTSARAERRLLCRRRPPSAPSRKPRTPAEQQTATGSQSHSASKTPNASSSTTASTRTSAAPGSSWAASSCSLRCSSPRSVR